VPKIEITNLGIVEVPEKELPNLQKIISAFSPERRAESERAEFLSDLTKLYATQSQETIELFNRFVDVLSSIKVEAPVVNVTVPDIDIPEIKLPAIEIPKQETPELNLPDNKNAKRVSVHMERVFGKPGQVKATVDVLEWE